MTTRMVHPKHGATHAYSANEIAQLEKIGWAIEKPAPVVIAPQIAAVEAATVEKRKPGRPPKAK